MKNKTRKMIMVAMVGAISFNCICTSVGASDLNKVLDEPEVAFSSGKSVMELFLEKLKGRDDVKSSDEMHSYPGEGSSSSAPGEAGPALGQKEETGPESDMPYPVGEDIPPVEGPDMSQPYEAISGISDVHAVDIFEKLEEYGFSKDEEGMTAPDGTTIWTIQKDNYTCDIFEDPDGNIYNSFFTASVDDYSLYFTSCAEGFGEDVLAWVKEHLNTNDSGEIEEAAVSITEGPEGYTMQICSKQYKEYIGTPE